MKNSLITAGILVAIATSIAAVAKPVDVTVQPSSPTPVQVNVPKQDTPVVNVEAPSVRVDAPAPVLGAVTGPDNYVNTFFHAGLTYGGNCFSTSTTGTLTALTMERNSCITIAATGAGQGTLSITLPASTTLSNVLPSTAGACRSWWIDNSRVAAATTTTIVAGTGWDMVGLDATGAGTGADVIDGLEFAQLTACRQSDGDVVGLMTEWIHAD
jgi:hypothetical protein